MCSFHECGFRLLSSDSPIFLKISVIFFLVLTVFIFLNSYSFGFFFYFIFLYNTVLVLPHINMNPQQVYMSSKSWTLLPPPSSYHLSGSSQCTSPKHPVSCVKPRLAIHFLCDIIHVSMPFSQIIPLLSLSHRVQKTVLNVCISFAVLHTGLSLPSF